MKKSDLSVVAILYLFVFFFCLPNASTPRRSSVVSRLSFGRDFYSQYDLSCCRIVALEG